MIQIRRSNERGHAQHGWLDSYHTFSFAGYHDPRFMGFRDLRVINEDRVQPAQGFPTHSHRDMEILTYVIDGALEHKDSMGNGSIIRPGDIQRMSAGAGVTHSEYNHSANELVHFLQIWVVPAATSIEPSYEQKNFSVEERTGKLRLIASADSRDGSIEVHQDVDIYATILAANESVAHATRPGRGLWLQVVRGELDIQGERLTDGDGVAVVGEASLELTAGVASEVLLFDLA